MEKNKQNMAEHTQEHAQERTQEVTQDHTSIHVNQLTPKQRQEVDHQYQVLQQGTVEIVPKEGLKQKLARSITTQKPLNIKLGLDPSAPDIHIGHTVVIQKLRQFQDFGHRIQLIIGDFTGKIGDPTGKSETRKPLTDKQVKQNAKTYIEQYGKILDMNRTSLFYNSEWLSALQFADVLELAAKMTVARMLERDDFEKDIKRSKRSVFMSFSIR